MKPFSYARAVEADTAVATISNNQDTKFIAGGTNLLDLMKEGVEQPDKLIDINRLPLTKIEETSSGGVRIGAMVSNTHTANHPLIRQGYPVLSQAFLAGATQQLRNRASVGGNLMQRTRCYYFVNPIYPCNKREPNTGCPAIEGYNRNHAILGTSEQCIAAHPSDMSVALAALDATVHLQGTNGTRTVPISEFHLLPETNPDVETVLQPNELITAVELPPLSWAKRSHYLKVRDRTSYAFALVSVAAALNLEGDTIKDARIACGGIGTKPWRASEVESALIGQRAIAETYQTVAEILVRNAQPQQHNAFKVELAKRTLVRALSTVATMRE